MEQLVSLTRPSPYVAHLRADVRRVRRFKRAAFVAQSGRYVSAINTSAGWLAALARSTAAPRVMKRRVVAVSGARLACQDGILAWFWSE